MRRAAPAAALRGVGGASLLQRAFLAERLARAARPRAEGQATAWAVGRALSLGEAIAAALDEASDA